MKNPEKVSPSALRAFLECPRKRLFRDVDRIKDESPKPWLAQGTRMHGHLEAARLNGGKLPDQTDPEARVASAAMQYWHESDWVPEQEIEIDRGDFVYFGFSDQLHVGEPAFVGDYKFTGSHHNMPRKGKAPFWWLAQANPRLKDAERIALASEALLDDVQWVVYGHFTGAQIVDGRWTYVIKPPKMEGQPKVLPVDLRDTRPSLEAKLEKFDVAARDLVRLRRTVSTANDAPHNADSACGGLGINCEYADICERKSEMAQMTVEEIMAQVNGQQKTEPAPEPEPPVEEAPAPPAPVVELPPEPEDPPKVNPPEAKEADLQATIEEVPVSPGKRKKKTAKKTKTPAPETPAEEAPEALTFEAQIVAATVGGVVELGVTESCLVIPVGARVKVTVL